MMDKSTPSTVKIEPADDAANDDWRVHFTLHCRQIVVNRVFEKLMYHVPSTHTINQLTEHAVKVEDKTFRSATTKAAYFKEIRKEAKSIVRHFRSTASFSNLDATGHCSNSQNVSGNQTLQHRLLNQKVQHPNISPSLVQSNSHYNHHHSQKRLRNLSQEAMQRPQTSAALLQPMNVIDRQQLLQSQRVLPEASKASARASAPTELTNRADWHDQAYQEVQSVREKCLPHLGRLHETFSDKHQLAQMPEQFKDHLAMIWRSIKFLKLTRSDMVHFPEMMFRQNLQEIDQYHSDLILLVRVHFSAIQHGFLSLNK